MILSIKLHRAITGTACVQLHRLHRVCGDLLCVDVVPSEGGYFRFIWLARRSGNSVRVRQLGRAMSVVRFWTRRVSPSRVLSAHAASSISNSWFHQLVRSNCSDAFFSDPRAPPWCVTMTPSVPNLTCVVVHVLHGLSHRSRYQDPLCCRQYALKPLESFCKKTPLVWVSLHSTECQDSTNLLTLPSILS